MLILAFEEKVYNLHRRYIISSKRKTFHSAGLSAEATFVSTVPPPRAEWREDQKKKKEKKKPGAMKWEVEINNAEYLAAVGILTSLPG